MLAIIIRTLKDRKISLIAYCISSVLLLFMYVAMYPSIKDESENFQKAFESYPEELFQAFDIKELNFSTIESFVDMEQFSIVWPIVAVIFLIAIATSGIAGEIERGTIENTLSRSISRTRYYFGKYIVGIISLFIFTCFSVFSLAPLAELYNLDYHFEAHGKLALLMFLFGWAIFSMAFMFSAIFSERSKTYVATSIIILAMYVINIISALKKNIEDIRYISFFHYFDHFEVLVMNNIELLPIIVFISVSVVFTIIGWIWFQKRDISI